MSANKNFRNYRLSKHQCLLIKVITEGTGNSERPWLTIDGVIDGCHRYGWPAVKTGIYYTLQSLMKRGMIERAGIEVAPGVRGNRPRQTLMITPRGRQEYVSLTNTGRMQAALDFFKSEMQCSKAS